MSRRIKILDTTLRDGEQSPGASMTEDQKVEMAIALDQLGVDRIEAGFPVSSPVQFNAVKRIAGVVENATVVGFARCVKKDIDAVHESLKGARSRMVHFLIGTSPLHMKYKLNMSKSEVLERAEKMLQYAQKYFDLIEFTAEDAARTEPEFLFQVMRMAVKNGAQTINIPDTVGYTLPHEYEQLFRNLVDEVPGIREGHIDLSAHCHNDLGVGVANTIAAIRGGATQAEVTINGIGERAGNCSLEELVMAMNVRKDQLDYYTNIKIERLYAASKLLQNITGLIIPKNKPIFGDNVFSHEAGIHQDGILKHKGTYEIMSPESIGRSRESLVMGRHSGKHAFKKKLEQYGLVLNPEQFNHCFEQFTIIADKKKEVYDEDIFNIVSDVLGGIEMGYQVDYFHSFTGNTLRPTASVKLKRDGNIYEAAANGDGPIDALYKSVNIALDIETKLCDFQIQAVGPNHDAQVQVKLMLRIGDESFVGKGSSTDSMEASVMAYINAINRKVLQDNKTN